MIRIFGFRKKDNVTNEIDRLIDLLEKDPKDTENWIRLAHLIVRTGDQKSAIRAYRTAAEQLGTVGLDLEAIAVYKKILSLDGVPLAKGSLRALQEAEELLAESRKAYEQIQMDLPDDKVNGALWVVSGEGQETPDVDDSEPVPIETLLTPSPGNKTPRIPLDANPEEDLPEDSGLVSVASQPSDSKEPDHDLSEVSSEALDALIHSMDQALDEGENRESVRENVTNSEVHSSGGEERQTVLSEPQVLEAYRAKVPEVESSSSKEKTGCPTTSPDPADLELIETLERQLKEAKGR